MNGLHPPFAERYNRKKRSDRNTFGFKTRVPVYSFKTLLQKKVDNSFAGRVFAVVGSVGNASIPGAMIVYGFLLEIYDFQDLLMISGLVLIPLSIISFILYKEEKHVRATEVISKSFT